MPPAPALTAAAAWIPPVVQFALLCLFALAWWRADRKRTAEREAASEARHATVTSALEAMKTTLTEMRLALTGYVTIERHSASIAALHEKVNALDRNVAVLLDRKHRTT